MNKERIKVKCIGIDEEGKGIAKVFGKELHISGLINGETAIIEMSPNRKNLSGEVVSIEEKSKYRVEPKCPHYKLCGGCQLQHMSYEGQKNYKYNFVSDLLKQYGKINPILAMEDPYNYRNKVHSTLSSDRFGKVISGIYMENTHKVVSIDRCITQNESADIIIQSIIDMMKGFKMKPYDEDTENGFLRHILIKKGFATNQIMVVLVVASQMFPGKNNFVKALLKKHPEITTIVMNINNHKTSSVLGDMEKVIYGKGFIEDTLCGYTFQISPKSFYQINPVQTEVLYNKALEMADLSGNETALDAYCGIGTISIILSGRVKKVIGVELNKDAIKDAKTNAKQNNITNAVFYNADAGEFMTELSKNKQKIDVVFMDPPRSGSDEKFLTSVAKLSPKKVVYISCNPVTQQRDLKYLTKHGYEVKEIQPVDMFPMTGHVECCVLLTKAEK